MSKPARFIPPDAYPQMVTRAQAAAMARHLRSATTLVRAAQVIEERGESLREAVRGYAAELEAADQDYALIAKRAHDIRGFAETAGLLATGRIADGLCRYFENCDRIGSAPQPAIVGLHVDAIVRAASAQDEMSRMSDVVARELNVLVSRKLKELSLPRA